MSRLKGNNNLIPWIAHNRIVWPGHSGIVLILFCIQNPSNSLFFETTPSSADCPYEAPDVCTNSQPQTCCERINSSEMPTSTATTANAALNKFMLLLSVVLAMTAAIAL